MADGLCFKLSTLSLTEILIYILRSNIVQCSYNNLSRGFGDNIDWRTFEDGLSESKKYGKPLMLIIHKSWCGACKALKPKFASSKQIEDLSKNFIMVNAEDKEEPPDKIYSPDGSYIPRILFLDSAGDVKTEIYNEKGNSNYKYFYSDPTQVIDAMIKALQEIPVKVIKEESFGQPTESSRNIDEL